MLNIKSLKIRPKYTPAITIVDECDKADIGVGADIAFNNHELNGNWADLEYKIQNQLIGKNWYNWIIDWK